MRLTDYKPKSKVRLSDMQQLDDDIVKASLFIVSNLFDAKYYKDTNPDVAKSSIDPLGHFILNGLLEGRRPSINLNAEAIRTQLVELFGRSPGRADFKTLFDEHRRRQNILLKVSTKLRISSFKNWLSKFGNSSGFNIPTSRKKLISELEKICDLSAFNSLNFNQMRFEDSRDAVIYLLDEGYKTLDPLDFHLKPDPEFFKKLYPEAVGLSDAELYLHWLTKSVFQFKFISEAHLLRSYGVRATRMSDVFDHTGYQFNYKDIPSEWSKEKIASHFITKGLEEGRNKFQVTDAFLPILEDSLEHLQMRDAAKAARVAERFLFDGVSSPRIILIVAKQLIDLDRVVSARDILKATSSDVPIEQFWLEYYQSEVFKRVDKTELALPFMRAAIQLENDSIWALSEHSNLLAAIFDRQQDQANKLIELGETLRAQKVLKDAISSTYSNIAPYGGDFNQVTDRRDNVRPGSRPLRVGVLADCYLPQCRLYRVDQKLEQMERAGVHAKLYDFREDAEAALKDVGLYDIWIFYRTPAQFEVLNVIKSANQLCRPTIYEIDDLLFDPERFPESIDTYGKDFPLNQYHGLLLAPIYASGVARECEFGLASTPALAKELSKVVRSGNVAVHRNAMSAVHEHAIERVTSSPKEDTVKVFYGSGTRAHKKFFQSTFLDAMGDLMAKRENVELHVFGYTNSDNLKQAFPDRIFEREPEWNVLNYWKALSEADINVAVLKKSLLTDCKSEIKWLEAAMLGIPSITSATTTMLEVITEGETGLIARDKKEWVHALTTLVDNAPLRRRMGKLARKEVLENYSLEAGARSILDILEQFESDHCQSGATL